MGDHRVLQGESLEAFNEGISYILNRWSALRASVDFRWGGTNSHLKAQQLIADVCFWFTQSRGPFYIDDLKAFIRESMNDAFNLDIIDGSDEDMAGEILAIREECLVGDFRNVESLREASRIPNFYPRVVELLRFFPEDNTTNSNESTIEDGTCPSDLPNSDTNSDSVNKPD